MLKQTALHTHLNIYLMQNPKLHLSLSQSQSPGRRLGRCMFNKFPHPPTLSDTYPQGSLGENTLD